MSKRDYTYGDVGKLTKSCLDKRDLEVVPILLELAKPVVFEPVVPEPEGDIRCGCKRKRSLIKYVRTANGKRIRKTVPNNDESATSQLSQKVLGELGEQVRMLNYDFTAILPVEPLEPITKTD